MRTVLQKPISLAIYRMVGEGENRVKEYYYYSFPTLSLIGLIANTLPINQKIVTVSLQFKDVASGAVLRIPTLSQLALQSESKRPGIINSLFSLPIEVEEIEKLAITAQV